MKVPERIWSGANLTVSTNRAVIKKNTGCL